MKKGQIAEGVVQKLNFPNKGVLLVDKINGETIETIEKAIVKNVIPGQRVSIGINKVRKGKAEGRLLEVISPSEMETESACPHFGICGGCTYQTLPYEKQLEIKKNQVKELLEQAFLGHEDKIAKNWFEGIKGSPKQFAYRNKMEFSFGDEIKDGPLALGMHKRGSFYDIVTVDHCKIVNEDYQKILSFTLQYFEERKVPFYHKLRHEGYLRHLLVRRAVKTEEILVDLITTSQDLNGRYTEFLQGYQEGLRKLSYHGKMTGILHTVNDSLADVVQNDSTEILFGQDYFYEEILGLRFKITPFSFFQTNSEGAEVLYETARDFIGDMKDAGNKVLFDLYSGTGTIAQMMAPVVGKVIGVEIVEEAVEAAKKNAELNGLHNCEFLAGDVLKVLDEIKEKPDYIILDPPRDGIHPKALPKIIQYGVNSIVYISCKPTSLARDLEVFLENGYVVKRVCAVDMFPGTGHVENVCLLSRNC